MPRQQCVRSRPNREHLGHFIPTIGEDGEPFEHGAALRPRDSSPSRVRRSMALAISVRVQTHVTMWSSSDNHPRTRSLSGSATIQTTLGVLDASDLQAVERNLRASLGL